jgi:hypothetical protein
MYQNLPVVVCIIMQMRPAIWDIARFFMAGLFLVGNISHPPAHGWRCDADLQFQKADSVPFG